MKKVPLLYIGRRFENGVMSDVFLERGNLKKEARFRAKGRRYCMIGDWYFGHAKAKDLFISSTTPEEATGKVPDEGLLKKWRRLDDEAVELQIKEKASAKAKKRLDTFKTSSYYKLADACQGLSYFETHDFISCLVNEIQKGKK